MKCKNAAKVEGRFFSAAVHYLRNTSASTAVMFSLAMPAVLATAGVAIDFSIFNLKKTRLQAAADQSAIAAVKELTMVNAKTGAISQSAEAFARTIMGNSAASLTVGVEVGAKKDLVKVTLTETWMPYFAQYIGAQVTPVVAHATAKLAGTTNICVLALNPTATKAFFMDKQAKLKATGCAVYSDSSDPEGIRLDLSSQMAAALVCSVGGVRSNSTAITPAPTTDCPPLPDPLSSRSEPPVGACKATALNISSGKNVLDPGTYCGGLKITKKANVTFRPGNYVIKDGPFEISGDATVKSDNAAFFLKGEATVLKFTDATSIAMTGAISGAMAGLLFFEDRSVSLGRLHRINSSNVSNLTGTIYLPQGKLRIDPNSTVAQDSAYTAIVANQVEINEGPTLVLNTDYSSSNVPVPEGINLSSQVVLSD